MTHPTIEELREQLAGIDALIESAAVDEDYVSWSELRMRKDALPALIRRAEAEPVRQEIARLEAELAASDEELLRARSEPVEVPPERRRDLTVAMLRNQRLGGITSRMSRLGKNLDERRKELALLESGAQQRP